MANKKGKVLETIISIAGEISPTLGKTLDTVTGKLDGVNAKALAVAGGVGTLVLAAGKVGKELATMGDAYNKSINGISASTGLVGEELADMGEVMKSVYGSNFGENMEDVADGVAEVYRQTELMDEALADTTKAAYALRDTFGYDIPESARAAKAMMTNFGVSGEEAMSMIAAGAQNGLDYSGELIDSISEYSVQFSKLGFTADEMFQLFQQGADSGAWNLDKVGDAVKEFSIRSIDGSKTTKHAFESLGLDADKMMATFAAGGKGASIAFQGVLTALMEMDDQVQRDLIGVELFGTQWEDLGTEAMAAIADIQGGVYDTGNALDGMMDVKYDNLTDAFGAIKREVEVGLLPVASDLADAFVDTAPMIGDAFTSIGGVAIPILTNLVTALLPPLLDLLELILPLVTKAAEFFGKVINGAGTVFSWGVDKLGGAANWLFGGGKAAETAGLKGYATGGITNGISIAGEDPNYPYEFIISPNPAYRSQNLSYWAQAGRMLGADNPDFSLDGGSRGSYYEMGGVTFAPQVIVQGNADKQTIMEAIEAEYPEFIDLLEAWFAGRRDPAYD